MAGSRHASTSSSTISGPSCPGWRRWSSGRGSTLRALARLRPDTRAADSHCGPGAVRRSHRRRHRTRPDLPADYARRRRRRPAEAATFITAFGVLLALVALSRPGVPDETRAIADASSGSPRALLGAAPATALLDEQDLRVLRQRPEVVGHDLLQAVGHLAHVGHRRELRGRGRSSASSGPRRRPGRSLASSSSVIAT